MTDIKKQFGEKLKQIRKRKGYTQEKLAELIGMDTRNLCKMESGNNFPQIKNLENIVKVLDINIKELFDYTEDTKVDLKRKINSYIDKMSAKELRTVFKIITVLKDSK